MFKRFLQVTAPLGEAPLEIGRNDPAAALLRPNPAADREAPGFRPASPHNGSGTGEFLSFEEIYRGLPKAAIGSYGILKIAEMVKSPHLTEMSAEAKRSSLLMALDAAHIAVEDVLQDAMTRQRAINEYEDGHRESLQEFEERKLRENSVIQAELDRLTSQHVARIQSNLDEVAREQDAFRAWQKSKHQESQRISEAAALCVPPSALPGSSLASVVERVGQTGGNERLGLFRSDPGGMAAKRMQA